MRFVILNNSIILEANNRCYDLTALFGKGKEPKSADDARIKELLKPNYEEQSSDNFFESYIMKRLLKLEEENENLKEEIRVLKESKNVYFYFEDRDAEKHVYNVSFENGNVAVNKL